MIKIHKLADFFLITCLLACDSPKNKARQTGEQAHTNNTQSIDTVNRKISEKKPDSFSIRSIVKDFQNDKSITEIKGIQVDHDILYVEYCVYTGKKNRVLQGVNVIEPIKVNDYKSDGKCYPVTPEDFYQDIAPGEKNNQTSFFWNFEKLKTYEIYTCIKAPLRHYIIFDKNSDTVYHRLEELLD